MELGKRFDEATAYAPFSVSSLEPHKLCPIVQVFLPQRYSDVMKDADLESINSKAVALNLVYRGVCDSSKAYLLAIEP